MKNKYLLAVVPPKKIAVFADGYRKKYAKHTVYRLPPHITIYPPFLLNGITEARLKEMLKNGLAGTSAGTVRLNSFGYFTGKNNVAFFKPDSKSTKYLRSVFVKAVGLLNGYAKNAYEDYKPGVRIYHPHMTIAEKIPNEVLPVIKKELSLKKVDLSFDVSSIQLFKQQSNSNVWRFASDIKLYKK